VLHNLLIIDTKLKWYRYMIIPLDELINF